MPAFQSPRLRLALGLGDQELEQRLRPALDASDEVVIVARCLAADQLLEIVQSQQADAVLVAWSLHRLTSALLDEIDRPGVSVLLLVPDPREERWRRRSARVLGVDTDASEIVRELQTAAAGGVRQHRPRAVADPMPLKAPDALDPQVGGVIAVAGGVGSPGRTSVAINLAAALGVDGSAALVELDLCAPAIAAYLDRDPSRNVCTLAHTVRDEPDQWGAALADELQALGPRPMSGVVLCGPPKREMRSSVAPGLVERLISELAMRYRWVIVDVGAELLGAESVAASHRVALGRARQVLLVAAADFVGVWHARTALEQFERVVGIDRRRVSLILNQYDARFHHSRQEVEWHLGVPLAGVIPFDHAAMQRAIAEQRPAVLDPKSHAGRALLALAERLNKGKLRLPVDESASHHASSWWRRPFGRSQAPTPARLRLKSATAAVSTSSEVRSHAW